MPDRAVGCVEGLHLDRPGVARPVGRREERDLVEVADQPGNVTRRDVGEGYGEVVAATYRRWALGRVERREVGRRIPRGRVERGEPGQPRPTGSRRAREQPVHQSAGGVDAVLDGLGMFLGPFLHGVAEPPAQPPAGRWSQVGPAASPSRRREGAAAETAYPTSRPTA